MTRYSSLFDKSEEMSEMASSSVITSINLEGDEQKGFDCTVHLHDKSHISAKIVVGNSGAYQFRFDNKQEAEKVLNWVKREVHEHNPDLDLSRARVTEPRISGHAHLFRLVGEEQWSAFKNLCDEKVEHRPGQ